MKKILFKGVGTAVATPFDERGVNITEFIKLLNFQLSNEVDAIIVCGTTGEAPTLSLDEKKLLIETAVKIVGGKVPVIVGTGTNSTKKTIDDSILAKELGADGLLIVTPYYNKTTQKRTCYAF